MECLKNLSEAPHDFNHGIFGVKIRRQYCVRMKRVINFRVIINGYCSLKY